MDPQSLPDIDVLLRERVAHLRHMAAVDRWLEEMEERDGPLPENLRLWAERAFDEGDAEIAAKRARRAAEAQDEVP